jgi:hypothetical protein
VKLKRIVDWGEPTAGLTPSGREPDGAPVVVVVVVDVGADEVGGGADEVGGAVPTAPVLVVVFELWAHPVSAAATAIAVAMTAR